MNGVEDKTSVSYESLGLALPKEKYKEQKLGQEAFLELMLAQLKNQDPLKPMENGEFLGQIAQFSTVTGIQELQNTFSSLSSSLTSNQALQASSLVGRSVVIKSDKGVLNENGLSGSVELPTRTDELVVGIYDSAGQLVRNLTATQQNAGIIPFTWNGLNENGEAVSQGVYEIRATARVAGEPLALDTFTDTRVSSVTLGSAGEGLSLNVEGLGTLKLADVKQIK